MNFVAEHEIHIFARQTDKRKLYRVPSVYARIYRSAKKSRKPSGKRQRSCQLAYDVFASRSILSLDENDFEKALTSYDKNRYARVPYRPTIGVTEH